MNGRIDTVNSISPPQTGLHLSERAWMVLIGILLLNSVLRGIRPPNMWVYTHFLLNYDFGFSKRSLQGAAFGALNIPGSHTYNFAFWYMMTVFAANVLLLLWVMKRLCATGDTTARLTAALFASSLAVVVLAHIVGYGDQPALLITLLALATRNFYYRSILVAVLFPVCILIQETQFVIFFPLILFRFLIDLGDSLTEQRRRLFSLGLVFVCVVGTLLVVGRTHLSEASATALLQSIQADADYPLRPYKAVLVKTFTEFFGIVTSAYIQAPLLVRFLLLSWIVTLPTTAYLMRQTWSLMTLGGRPSLLRAAAMGASVAPLTLHLVAVDANRFASFALLTSFLVYVTVRLQVGIAGPLVSTTRRNLFLPIGLIAMNLSSSIPLFDGYVVRSFPYEELVHDLADTLLRKQPFPPGPEECTLAPPYECSFVQSPLLPPESGIYVSHTSKPPPRAAN